MNVEILAHMVAVASGLGAVFHFAVLRPLDITIKRIEKMLDRMDERFIEQDHARQNLEIKLAEVDQRAKAAHNRLDEIYDAVLKKHHQ